MAPEEERSKRSAAHDRIPDSDKIARVLPLLMIWRSLQWLYLLRGYGCCNGCICLRVEISRRSAGTYFDMALLSIAYDIPLVSH